MAFDSTLYDDGNISVLMPLGVPFLHTEAVKDSSLLEKQRELAESIVKEHADGWGANWAEKCGSWNSTDIYNNILTEYTEFEPIIDNLKEYLSIFAESMSINLNNENPVITQSWLNANPPGNVQECHIHPFSYFAVVYYIHIPSGGGSKFVLDNPLSYEWPPEFNGVSPYRDQVIDVRSGDLIMFPTNIDHHTTVNKSNEFRYSLAFNIALESYIPPNKTNN